MSTSLLADRIVAITGASRGIGRGCAVECAKHGAKGLVLHYFGDAATQAEVDALATELSTSYGTKVITVPGDIGLHETSLKVKYCYYSESVRCTLTEFLKIVGEAIQAFGRIDVLVSNAGRLTCLSHVVLFMITLLVGICPFADFLDMDVEVWHRTRSVNLDGAFYITQAVARQMKEQVPQGGSIIGISSISALVGGGQQVYVHVSYAFPYVSYFERHYTPTKAGILSLMQSTAVALGKYGIRANAILPGTILTDINKEDLSNAEKRVGMEKRTCLGRLGREQHLFVLISRRLNTTRCRARRYCRPCGLLGQRHGEIRYWRLSSRRWRTICEPPVDWMCNVGINEYSRLCLYFIGKFFSFHDDRFCVYHDGGPSCPLGSARIPPCMQRSTLHYGITGVLQMCLAAIIKYQDQLAMN